MVSPKKITCLGIEYNSVLALAQQFGIHQSTVARRLRDGWIPEEAVGVTPKSKRKGHGISVTYQGKQFPHLKALAEELGIDGKTFRARLSRGYSLEDAASGKMNPRVSAVAKKIEFEGNTYPSRDSLAKAHGTDWSIVSKRLSRGWSLRQALGVDPEPPRFRNHEGHARDTKWKNTRQSIAGVEPVPDAEGYKIYLITNVNNGKQYVGLTIGTLHDRLKQHFASARKGRKAPLPNAIRKYGENAFTISLIRTDARTYEELQEQEINEIANRGTLKNGYNSAVGGAVGITKPITIDGKRFASRSQAAQHYEIDVSVFNMRITRLKWTPEEAAGLEERSWKGKEVEVVVEGVKYPSIRQAAISLGKDFRKVYDRFSEKGWALEQALDLASPPDTVKATGLELTAYGTTYKSIAKAAEAHGINPESLRRRIIRGNSPEAAITEAKLRKRSIL
ncbi:MAG: GIY-YIG nuclease family protein [Burkholderiaceae bacterium]